MEKDFNEYTLIDMMFENSNIEDFKNLWNRDRDTKKWGRLLSMCYCEESYESVGGDDGDLDNPSINFERLKYLEHLIDFLENLGIKEIK